MPLIFFFCELISKTMQEKTCLSHSLCFSSVRGQTQQTKDDNVVYLNTIQSQLEEEKKKKNKRKTRRLFHKSFKKCTSLKLLVD